MKSDPNISIVTVTLNAGAALRKTLDSVQSQSYPRKELVVVDGGSTDETISIAKEYGSLLRAFVSESDNGIYDAMNKGISMSSGEWVVFMNSGDRFSNRRSLADITRHLKSRDVYVFGANAQRPDGTSRTILPPAAIKKGSMYFRIPACHQATLFPRDRFEQIGVFNREYRSCADHEWLLRHFQQDGRIASQPLVVADYGPPGFSSSDPIGVLKERKSIADNYFPVLRAARINHAVYRYLLVRNKVPPTVN
jgi:glycosyltransferase involved in cell wall biosynthesis